MSESPCRCWHIARPTPHEGHCCIQKLPADWKRPDGLPCGHLEAGLAIDERRKAGAS